MSLTKGGQYVFVEAVEAYLPDLDFDPDTGMVIDLSELKAVVGETIIERFDHADLNADPAFRSRVPTTENIAIVVWDLLIAKLGEERLWQVRIWEDPTLYVDYRGAR